ncbi:MAG: hypothetical protein N2647_02700 [Thermodesulfovibrio sp.]|nr:hypothetical protein [Thermodesulfovibrio sp.]
MKTREILATILILIIPNLAMAFDCGYIGYKGCAIAEIKQIGFSNNAKIDTAGLNKTSIWQEGIANQANITQTFAIFGNNAELSQTGNYNFTYQHQMGINNYAYSEQTGSLNSTVQEQKGQGNIAKAKQFGIGNEAVQLQLSSFNSASVLQIGFYNKTYQIQGIGTMGNKSNLIQMGFGVITIVVQ